ncbi:hypothetical protein K438DRAFT_1943603 [Mycena galopus ATCC 62051]|nr:hypothetical protein K438DRAFT_1943603 [Mycena galopus ATCC 62051]
MPARKRRAGSASNCSHVSDMEPEESCAVSDVSFVSSQKRGRTLKRSPEPKRPYNHPVAGRDSPYSHVSDSEESYAAPDASLSRPTRHKPSYDTSRVPVELWTMIASFTSRPSLASLCSVSHYFHSFFRSLLYTNTMKPPLNPSQTALLLRTLGAKKTACANLHPALLVRDLGIVDEISHQTLNAAKVTKALHRLHLAKNLRALHWTLADGVDELGKIFGAPGRFPCLRELVVSLSGTEIDNFNFVQIQGLEVLGVTIDFEGLTEWDFTAEKLCWKLAEALQMLPYSSPVLHTLKLKLKIPFYTGDFPSDAYNDVIAAINGIHLAVLMTLDLSMDLIPGDEYAYSSPLLPETEFFPFLSCHPNLLHLTLNAHGTKLTEEDGFLPRLQSFQGSFEDAIIICARPRQLQNLVLVFVHLDFPYWAPSFSTLPLAGHLSLTYLQVFAVDAAGNTMKERNQLSPVSFHELVSSFPNLTHLDVLISEQIPNYYDDLILLARLQSLRVQEYRTRQLGPSKWPARLAFPPDDYKKEFAILLPLLPELARIEISLLGDTYQHSFDSPDFDWNEICSPPELHVEYCFSVLRPSSGAHMVLDRARVKDCYSKIPTI